MKIKSIRLNDKDEIMLAEITKWYSNETGIELDESKLIRFLIKTSYEFIKQNN